MMQEHEFSEGWCLHCGASEAGCTQVAAEGNTSTCNARADTVNALRPEPARRVYASEDFDAIGERMRELEAERVDDRSD